MLDQGLDFAAIWADIVKRPYITVGMLAFTILVPLAVTSNNAMIRRLGGARLAAAASARLRGGRRGGDPLHHAGEVLAPRAARSMPRLVAVLLLFRLGVYVQKGCGPSRAIEAPPARA